jgi:hypothetical protein
MKNHLILKAIPALLLVCASGFASAADSSTLAVTATVNATCKFSAASTPLVFGAIDPSLSADKVVTANVKYKCTKSTASLGITGISGAHTMTDGTNSLSYTLGISGDASTGTGFGAGQDLTAVVTGTITAAQYQNAVASTGYAENVTLSITP